jgi:hypothetical protein
MHFGSQKRAYLVISIDYELVYYLRIELLVSISLFGRAREPSVVDTAGVDGPGEDIAITDRYRHGRPLRSVKE